MVFASNTRPPSQGSTNRIATCPSNSHAGGFLAEQLASHHGLDNWAPCKWPAGVEYSYLVDEKAT